MDASHVFPQGVLAMVLLIGDVIGVGVSGACAILRCICSVVVTVLSGIATAPHLLE